MSLTQPCCQVLRLLSLSCWSDHPDRAGLTLAAMQADKRRRRHKQACKQSSGALKLSQPSASTTWSATPPFWCPSACLPQPQIHILGD